MVDGNNTGTEARALLAALHFAADKHRDGRRKDPDASPYINHPIEVAETLARHGNAANTPLLQAAILHDTVEDTDATAEEIGARFGSVVRELVEAVSDDKGLPKAERKRLQIEHAPGLSRDAKQLKIADKICTVRDVTHSPPKGWEQARRARYLQWARQVVNGCKGVNPGLEAEFEAVLAEGEAALGRR